MSIHHEFMKQAIAEGEKARFHAPPNPWVGCIIVKDGQIIAKGHTQPPGQAHAEVVALQEAKEAAKGSTMYVTLEPCSHYGRTSPCVDAIIKSGIAKVIIAVKDPDSRVCGNGVEALQKAGISVEIGICEEEVIRSFRSYFYHRTKGNPFTIMKAAMSVDGRTAAEDGSSKWITCEAARLDVHRERAHAQAIIIGAGTAHKDYPKLTVRHPECKLSKQPLRVILDSRGKVKAHGPLFDMNLAQTLIITTELVEQDRKKEWLDAGVEVVVVPNKNQHIDLHEAWKELGKRGILQAYVEGGSTLHSALLEANLINQLSIYVGSLLLGSGGMPLLTTRIPTLSQAQKLTLDKITHIGECAKLDYFIS